MVDKMLLRFSRERIPDKEKTGGRRQEIRRHRCTLLSRVYACKHLHTYIHAGTYVVIKEAKSTSTGKAGGSTRDRCLDRHRHRHRNRQTHTHTHTHTLSLSMKETESTLLRTMTANNNESQSGVPSTQVQTSHHFLTSSEANRKQT